MSRASKGRKRGAISSDGSLPFCERMSSCQEQRSSTWGLCLSTAGELDGSRQRSSEHEGIRPSAGDHRERTTIRRRAVGARNGKRSRVGADRSSGRPPTESERIGDRRDKLITRIPSRCQIHIDKPIASRFLSPGHRNSFTTRWPVYQVSGAGARLQGLPNRHESTRWPWGPVFPPASSQPAERGPPGYWMSLRYTTAECQAAVLPGLNPVSLSRSTRKKPR
jgi:hypothetical protein